MSLKAISPMKSQEIQDDVPPLSPRASRRQKPAALKDKDFYKHIAGSEVTPEQIRALQDRLKDITGPPWPKQFPKADGHHRSDEEGSATRRQREKAKELSRPRRLSFDMLDRVVARKQKMREHLRNGGTLKELEAQYTAHFSKSAIQSPIPTMNKAPRKPRRKPRPSMPPGFFTMEPVQEDLDDIEDEQLRYWLGRKLPPIPFTLPPSPPACPGEIAPPGASPHVRWRRRLLKFRKEKRAELDALAQQHHHSPRVSPQRSSRSRATPGRQKSPHESLPFNATAPGCPVYSATQEPVSRASRPSLQTHQPPDSEAEDAAVRSQPVAPPHLPTHPAFQKSSVTDAQQISYIMVHQVEALNLLVRTTFEALDWRTGVLGPQQFSMFVDHISRQLGLLPPGPAANLVAFRFWNAPENLAVPGKVTFDQAKAEVKGMLEFERLVLESGGYDDDERCAAPARMEPDPVVVSDFPTVESERVEKDMDTPQETDPGDAYTDPEDAYTEDEANPEGTASAEEAACETDEEEADSDSHSCHSTHEDEEDDSHFHSSSACDASYASDAADGTEDDADAEKSADEDG